MQMQKLSKINEIADFDEPIREILGKTPIWIIRWGNTMILIFFISLLGVSIIIKYPEVIYSNAKLISIDEPKPVIVKITGKIMNINVNEGEKVSKGDVIGYMESVADKDQVFAIYDKVRQMSEDSVSKNKLNFDVTLSNISHNQLGELQVSFQSFSKAYLSYKNYIHDSFYEKKRRMLLIDIHNLNSSIANLYKQKELIKQDVALSENTLLANESLRNNKIISELEYRTEKSKVINKRISLPQIIASILSTENFKNEKLKEIMELDNMIELEKFHFNEALSTLKSQIEDWLDKHVLTAPSNGSVNYKNFVQSNHQFQAGQILCYISQPNTQHYAEMFIPQPNFGKVMLGQKVLLKFPSYPYQEYGVLEGKIIFISQIGTDSGYLSKVKLSNDLLTKYKRKIQYKNNMIANAEIITKDMRLIERFYYKIIKLVENEH